MENEKEIVSYVNHIRVESKLLRKEMKKGKGSGSKI